MHPPRYTSRMSRASKERERRERARQYKAGVKPYDLIRLTAFHEAGHVVFSTLNGNPVEIVTIDMHCVEELTGRKGCPPERLPVRSEWLAKSSVVFPLGALTQPRRGPQTKPEHLT